MDFLCNLSVSTRECSLRVELGPVRDLVTMEVRGGIGDGDGVMTLVVVVTRVVTGQ